MQLPRVRRLLDEFDEMEIAAVLAAATSATLFYFGTGLRPMPWCTWLAPLPVLVLAPRVSARTAFTAACAAWLGARR